ncbi:MAG TPA: hypothetical protein VFZ53_20915 [Polyangiaceae bacterium]
MQSSGDETFDEFQLEFMAYLERRLGVKREEATTLLGQWLGRTPRKGGSGSRTRLTEAEAGGRDHAASDGRKPR